MSRRRFPLNCVQCEQIFLGSSRTRLYCSCVCMGKANRRPDHICVVCHQPFHGRNRYNKYCSRPCFYKADKYTSEDFWRLSGKAEPGDCWIWQGADGPGEYGQFGHALAHRYSYALNVGPIPAGLFVCHNCPTGDNPRCVNPAHLWLGTAADNNCDASHKQTRAQRHARISDEDIRAMLQRWEAGDITQKALATLYGISRARVSLLVRKMTRVYLFKDERNDICNLAS